MHDDHHHHSHDHGDGHHHGPNGHHHHPHPVGHNGPPGKPLQWQTPHLPHDHAPEPADARATDLDLVEIAFLEGFSRAPDPSSFLRLAGIPFVGETADGVRLHLLRVETQDMVDVGAVMPLIGGAGVTYHPLPAKLTSRRRRLAFVYHNGQAQTPLDFGEARLLADRSGAAQFTMPGAGQ
ncbi:hypothetical protein NKH33_31410 [Mesorhizobium sp. M1182]|uniref:hypothetical protein n=1 Tax=unclassified Mesorhizobium TaxID=325217 RepID=UPI003339C4C8